MQEYLFKGPGDPTWSFLIDEYCRSPGMGTLEQYLLTTYNASFFELDRLGQPVRIRDGIRFTDTEKYIWFMLKLG